MIRLMFKFLVPAKNLSNHGPEYMPGYKLSTGNHISTPHSVTNSSQVADEVRATAHIISAALGPSLLNAKHFVRAQPHDKAGEKV
jgi:hypothetical protein